MKQSMRTEKVFFFVYLIIYYFDWCLVLYICVCAMQNENKTRKDDENCSKQ